MKIKKRCKYIRRGHPEEGKLLTYEDDLRQIDGQYKDFALLTEFWYGHGWNLGQNHQKKTAGETQH